MKLWAENHQGKGHLSRGNRKNPRTSGPLPEKPDDKRYNRLEAEGKSFEELEYLTLGTLKKAVQEGDTTNGTVMAGQIAGLVTKEQTCKEMIDEMMEQADKLLGGCQR